MTVKKISIITILILLTASLTWWFIIRKQFLKDTIRQTVGKQTERLYRLTYDSLSFNEVMGNATFYNLQLQVDSSVLKRIITYDTIPGSLAHVSMKSLEISGLKSLDLLSGNALDVDGIVLRDPKFTLTKFTTADTTKITANDTLELYKTILGKYNFIHANSIEVTGGAFNYKDKQKASSVSVERIQTAIKNFTIDSLHNYNNIIAYFIKDAVLSTGKAMFVKSNDTAKSTALQALYYNAAKGVLSIDTLTSAQQTIGNIAFEGLHTSDFVTKQKFNTKKLTVSNVTLSVKQNDKKSGKTTGKTVIEIPGMFSTVKVDSFKLVNANITTKKEGKTTAIITGINALVNNIVIDDKGLNAETYFTNTSFALNVAEWKLLPAKEVHIIKLKGIKYSYKNRLLQIDKFTMQPGIKNKQLAVQQGVNRDLFTMFFKDISANNVDLKELLFDNKFKASRVTMQLDLSIYNDKTLRIDTAIKKGTYPQQKLLKLPFEIDISSIKLNGSRVAYTEKSSDTKLEGKLFFSNISATITNIHNKANLNQPLTVDIKARFMGSGALTTKWQLFYNPPPGENVFVTGNLAKFNLQQANPFVNALGRIKMNSGMLNSLSFMIDGSRKGSKGFVNANYDDLKFTLLKQDNNDSLEEKKTVSFLANLAVKNKNHRNKNETFVYKGKDNNPFFGLLWRSIFEGIKKTVL